MIFKIKKSRLKGIQCRVNYYSCTPKVYYEIAYFYQVNGGANECNAFKKVSTGFIYIGIS
jgi:hypothetical protein